MWNVFDASFSLIFLTYFVLRVKGIVQGDGKLPLVILNSSLPLVVSMGFGDGF